MSTHTSLPVAPARDTRAYARRLALRHPRELTAVLALYALAAGCGLVGPRLLGDLVEDTRDGGGAIARTALLICVFVIVQALLTHAATYASARLGEKVLAELRERFVGDVLALPLATVERAGAGDLVTRTIRDVEVLAGCVRRAVPATMTALVTIAVTFGALFVVGPLLAFPCLIAVPVLWAASRWFFGRSREAFLRQSASYARITEGLTETVEGARTVEALRLAPRRAERTDRDIAGSYAAERHTIGLLTVFLPIVDTAYVLPVAATLVLGGLFALHGMVSLAAVTAATLYVQQLLGPVDTVLYCLGDLQAGAASLARLRGVHRAPAPGAPASGAPAPGADASGTDASAVAAPRHRGLALRGVRYAYREDRDVLRGIDLEIEPGERLAVVGPSGAGKSTLGRLLAGIHAPRTGSVTVGGVPLAELSPDRLRGQVALVTQETYVFAGTLRENLLIAAPGRVPGPGPGRGLGPGREPGPGRGPGPGPGVADAELERALDAVGAREWALELGLDARVGAGSAALAPDRVQQLSLARLVLADPHTLVLDEATSLLDPRAARRLERSLAALLEARTVIAIAHRLHTAHDADRVAVMENGRITELGPHDELVARGGAYAALWESWHGRT
ncbi:ABC transporter ATP-binding protein [Streptomyces malaysiensis]|uniref:ABC transporter ATP-binding protein n=1 Tax=Streptomyces malaysiensis TaxID=92644 RepID=UPI000BFB9B59|nr:ABC transporter ATP-binding protein [Streptomyces malaysiensis]ATL87142.1 ABC transporter ATP-binding and permease protein [Streptomyces malaysiensis]